MFLSFNPPSYGVYHFSWIAVTIVCAVLCCIFLGRKHNEKVDKWFIFTVGAILLVGELFKQIYLTKKTGHYNWDQFPLQFCSVPMYVATLSVFVKNKKVKDALYSFLGFFALVAGIAVMAEPSGVFWYPYTPMVIHSTIWHSAMVILGIYILFARSYGKKFSEVLKGYIVLLCVVAIALAFNEIMYYTVFINTGSNYCNAFYLSSHYPCQLPILYDIQQAVPYPIFILAYLAAFFVGISLVWGVLWLIRKICTKKVKKQKGN